ncbi:DUF2624 family protein [Virgibacillus halophilus]|uniref:DUF2624 family protein n=1 Tax=Tigheibacillus halophilus TaxID=361280 RepID=A0ABU5CD13_9BACI|nr:DUF2624 family protein [Virgibacillus halophilus]
MSILFKELINQRLRKITVTELLDYSNQYGFSLDRSQAKDIVSYLKTNNINPFTKKRTTKNAAAACRNNGWGNCGKSEPVIYTASRVLWALKFIRVLMADKKRIASAILFYCSMIFVFRSSSNFPDLIMFISNL